MKYWVDQIRALEWGLFEAHSPAHPSEITNLEMHLGFALPNDLKEFYLNANGITGDNNGWEYQLIGSISETIENIESIKKDRNQNKTLFSDLGKSELIYPEVLKKLTIIPLDNAENSSGAGAFYITEGFSRMNKTLTMPGIYRYLASQPSQIRDPEITFVARSIEDYLIEFFGFDNKSEGAFL